jgi:hypothetical protein
VRLLDGPRRFVRSKKDSLMLKPSGCQKSNSEPYGPYAGLQVSHSKSLRISLVGAFSEFRRFVGLSFVGYAVAYAGLTSGERKFAHRKLSTSRKNASENCGWD